MLESARLHQVLLGNRTDSLTHTPNPGQSRQEFATQQNSGPLWSFQIQQSLPRHFHINIDHNCHKQGEKTVLGCTKQTLDQTKCDTCSQTLSTPKFNGYSSTLMDIATKLIPQNSFTIPLPRKTIYSSQWGENKHQSHNLQLSCQPST
jgi:hypothetical protein